MIGDGDVAASDDAVPGRPAPARWRGLERARSAAAAAGATSVDTGHVLLALLAGPDGEARDALREAGVDDAAVRTALAALVGSGMPPVAADPASLRLSAPVQAVLAGAAAQARDGATGPAARPDQVDDRDVLAALLARDDSAAHVVLRYLGARRVLLDHVLARAVPTAPR